MGWIGPGGGSSAESTLAVNATTGFGAKVNGRRVRDVTSAVASPIVKVPGAEFLKSGTKAGMLAMAYSDTAGGVATTIERVVSESEVELAANAGILLNSTGYFAWGSDDSTALKEACEAAQAAANEFSEGFNQPKGAGLGRLTIPANKSGGFCLLGNALTVPTGVEMDCQALVGGLLANRFISPIKFEPYTNIRRLELEALFGQGLTLGKASGEQANIKAQEFTVWHPGSEEKEGKVHTGLIFLGSGFLCDLWWIKGTGPSRRGFNAAACSDCTLNRGHIIGCQEPGLMTETNQFKGQFILDTCGRSQTEVEATTEVNGINIEKGCSDIDITVQAFHTNTVIPARKLKAVVAVGAVSAVNNVDIKVVVQAQKTGGIAINFEHAQDVVYGILGSNTASGSSGGENLTQAVKFGTVAGSCTNMFAGMNTSIVPYSGTVQPFDYERSSVKYQVQGIVLPTTAAGASAGAGAPKPEAMNANGSRGELNLGTGTAATAGQQIILTFADSTGYVAAPVVDVFPLNAAAALASPFCEESTTTGFTIGFAVIPASSKAIGTFKLGYRIVG